MRTRHACCWPTPTWCRAGAPGSTFNELDRKGLMMYGQMTAGSWIYIGSQGIVQGTYETFVEMGRQHYGGNLAGRWLLTAGLGGMGGAQPLASGDGRRVLSRHRVPAIAHRHAPEVRLPGSRHRQARRSTEAHRRILPGPQAHLGGTAGQRRGTAAGDVPARRAPRPADGPDQRARSGQWLSTGRLDGRAVAGAARQRSGRHRHGRPKHRWPFMCRPCWISRRPASPPWTTATTSARWRWRKA